MLDPIEPTKEQFHSTMRDVAAYLTLLKEHTADAALEGSKLLQEMSDEDSERFTLFIYYLGLTALESFTYAARDEQLPIDSYLQAWSLQHADS